jgi:hypothetical protein
MASNKDLNRHHSGLDAEGAPGSLVDRYSAVAR